MPIPVNASYESQVHPGNTVWAVQEPGAFDLLRDLVKEEAPEIIIELGTCAGGLTLVLHEALPEAWLFSFDICNDPDGECVSHASSGFQQVSKALYGPRVIFCQANVLKHAPTHQMLELALAQDGRKLLLCDNGLKRAEVALYAPRLTKGDVIGVHDWNEEIRAEDVAETLAAFEPLRWQECEERKSLWRFWRRVE